VPPRWPKEHAGRHGSLGWATGTSNHADHAFHERNEWGCCKCAENTEEAYARSRQSVNKLVRAECQGHRALCFIYKAFEQCIGTYKASWGGKGHLGEPVFFFARDPLLVSAPGQTALERSPSKPGDCFGEHIDTSVCRNLPMCPQWWWRMGRRTLGVSAIFAMILMPTATRKLTRTKNSRISESGSLVPATASQIAVSTGQSGRLRETLLRESIHPGPPPSRALFKNSPLYARNRWTRS